eukprot:scaffold3630_cov306-Prasinococcus_capsulatus_cf.AAC.3
MGCQVVDGKLVVEDLDSTNGTFVNGRKLRPLEERALKAGDKITLGDGKRNADADTFATYEVRCDIAIPNAQVFAGCTWSETATNSLSCGSGARSVGEGGAGGFSLFGF